MSKQNDPGLRFAPSLGYHMTALQALEQFYLIVINYIDLRHFLLRPKGPSYDSPGSEQSGGLGYVKNKIEV